MANVAKPKSDNLSELSQVSVPVSYSTLTGLALLLSDIIVSGKKVVPFTRAIPTASFISGNYGFPTPNGYVAAPYQLPMLEPQSWNVVADIISAYQPVELYQIGNKSYVNDQGITVPADYMTTTFPIKIYPSNYSSDSGAVKPLEINQSVIVRVYKNAGVAINWQSSNILNNGLTDEAIQAATELTFVVTNVLGKYQITEWLTPDFVLTDLSSVKTTAKNSLAAIVNELYDRAGSSTPTGPAGGDLTGTYPNPAIGNGKVTAAKMAAGVIPTTLPPSGAAGGDLTGTYPSPTIGTGKVTNVKLAGGITADKMAAGVIPTTLPPSGAAGGDLSGSYPNPTIGAAKVTADKLDSSALPFITVTSQAAFNAVTVPVIGGVVVPPIIRVIPSASWTAIRPPAGLPIGTIFIVGNWNISAGVRMYDQTTGGDSTNITNYNAGTFIIVSTPSTGVYGMAGGMTTGSWG